MKIIYNYKNVKLSMALPVAKDYPKPYGDKEYPVEKDEDTKYLKYNTITISDIDDILKNTGIIDQFGPLKYIGSGTNGIVYETRDDQIIKITKDITEYEASKSIQEYQEMFNEITPHVVQIYYVDKIPIKDLIGPNTQSLYIINMEKVLQLNELEKNMVKKIETFFSQNKYFYDKITLKRKKEELYKRLNQPNKELYSQIFDKFFDMTNFLIEKMNMSLSDINHENIGKRENGEYVLMDVGGSFS